MPARGEGIQDQVPDQGKGLFSDLGGKLGKIPGLSKAIQAGAMLGILGGAASLEGCTPENGQGAVGSEKAGQGYGTMEAALTADEMKALTTPKAVAGTQLTDGNPEFGDIGGKKVMFITREKASQSGAAEGHLFYKLGDNLKGLVDSGTFVEIKGTESLFTKDSSSVRGVSMYKNKLYISMSDPSFSVAESDIVLNAQGELEVSNFKEVAGDMSSCADIKVIEMGGVPYLYGTSLTMQRKNLITGVIEDLIPDSSKYYLANVPAYHKGTWTGNRGVQSGGQEVQRAYSASTAEGVATSSTPVLKLNQGIQANTGDIAIAEDGERVIVAEVKWNEGYPTSVVYSEFVKPVNPNPDAGSTEVDGGATDDVDAGPSGTDVASPEVDTGATDDADAGVQPDTAETADDTADGTDAVDSQELPQQDDAIDGTDTSDTLDAADTSAELPPQPDVVDGELPLPDGQTQPDTAETADDAADGTDAGTPDLQPQPDALVGSELPPQDDAADGTDAADTLDAADTSAELPPQPDVVDGELPPPDAQTQPDATEVADDSKVGPELPPPDAQSEVTPADIASEIAAEVADDTSSPQPDPSETSQDLGMTELPKGDDSSQGSDGLPQQDSAQNVNVGSSHSGSDTSCAVQPGVAPDSSKSILSLLGLSALALLRRRKNSKK